MPVPLLQRRSPGAAPVPGIRHLPGHGDRQIGAGNLYLRFGRGILSATLRAAPAPSRSALLCRRLTAVRGRVLLWHPAGELPGGKAEVLTAACEQK